MKNIPSIAVVLMVCSVFALPVAAFASHDYQMAYHPTTYTTYPTTYYTDYMTWYQKRSYDLLNDQQAAE